ncbi:SDR family NAD(P)-dependent oxidoreductase [Streptomyces luteolifulvus]|uniref:SDR family NAD(P)-dependent oxidoreductase n=1 Tax=Streptomyces luteolifulvus TaxID=2615112 RepID=A0A6H9UYF9_9ACTN|nr:SDR family NAD(P)-dependent oxidoreductase [Streptomyces luteolifulvus]
MGKGRGLTERRSAIVTGAAGGIGRDVAVRLAADGYDIAFCDGKGTKGAAETAERIQDLGSKVFFSSCNVADQDDADRFVRQSAHSLGPVSVLVNAAGIVLTDPSVTPPDDWGDVSDINLLGTFNLCRALVPMLIGRGDGAVVNLSSVSGRHDDADALARCSVVNTGIQGMSIALAKEVVRHGIRVNVVAPGLAGATGCGDEVAALVSFIVSGRAASLTGKVIYVA